LGLWSQEGWQGRWPYVRTLARTYIVACSPPLRLPADALWGEIRRPQRGSCACHYSRSGAVMARIRADSPAEAIATGRKRESNRTV